MLCLEVCVEYESWCPCIIDFNFVVMMNAESDVSLLLNTLLTNLLSGAVVFVEAIGVFQQQISSTILSITFVHIGCDFELQSFSFRLVMVNRHSWACPNINFWAEPLAPMI